MGDFAWLFNRLACRVFVWKNWKPLILSMIIVGRVAVGQTASSTTPSTLPQVITDTERRLADIERQYQAQVSSQNAQIESINSKLLNLGSSSAASVDELKKAVDVLKTKQDTTQARNAEVLREKYKAGADLLDDMIGSASTVTVLTKTLLLEQYLGKATNLWNEAEFRNSFDQVQTWGTTVGAVVGAVGSILLASGKSPEETKGGTVVLASGAGVIGIAQLVGNIWGSQNGDKIKKKAQFIEVTVHQLRR